MVVPLVSKYTSFDLVPTKIVYMHKLAVILFENFSEFGVLSSTLHNIWCWKNSSTLGAGTLNYSTTDCFETFPFPITLNNKELETVSRKYNSLRKKIMCDNRLGMTKLYNQFHNDRLLEISNLAHFPSNGKEFEKIYGKENFSFLKHLCKYSNNTSIKDACRDILELRELYCKIDISVLNAYGWSDISLKHDFYEVDYLPENDRVRFTIHPNARKEILRRLLLLNHEQYSKEQESLPSKQNRRIKIKNDQSFIDLFSDV
ncbi:type IIL restriction-modification enzyme MmeI [Bacteroides fragilis]|jgi:hypothetical protein